MTFTPYDILLVLAAVTALALAILAWHRKLNRGATSFALLMLAVALWCSGHIMEMSAADLSGKIFWADIQFIAIVSIPVFWIAFILPYTGQTARLPLNRAVCLSIVPAVSLVMAWTNNLHGFFFSNSEIITKNNFSFLIRTFNTGFWIHSFYSYLLLLIGTILLIRTILRTSNPYRGRSVLLLAGALTPWACNALYIFRIEPFAYFDLTPFGFTLSGLLFGLGIFQFHFLDIVPIAYDTVFHNMNEGLILLDPGSRIINLNPAARKILDVKTSEAIGAQVTEVFSRWPDLLEGYRGHNMNYDFEFKKNNSGLIYNVAVSHLYMKKILRGYLITMRDITAHKKSETELRKSEEMFKALSENASDIIYTLDADGSFSYVNPAWKKILGYSRQETLGMYFIEFTRKEDSERSVQIFRELIKDRRVFTDTIIKLQHKDGSIRVFTGSASPNIDAAGKIIGITGSLKDLTDQQKLATELQQAHKMEAVGTLASAIVHDFNNIFMAIQGNISLIRKRIDQEEYAYQKIRNIEQSVDKGTELTRQLLSFVLGSQYVVTPTNLNDIVRRTSNMFSSGSKQIKIYKHYQNNLWLVDLDPVQVGKVLMNIYKNAAEAMDGKGELYVGTKNITLGTHFVKPFRAVSGKYVEISIRDTGCGMSEEIKQKIFEPFFTTREPGKGSGLGLSFARAVA
ncbi:MAG: hypothetical protein DRH32_08440, partial [Deltaproteobacteria bacterium]